MKAIVINRFGGPDVFETTDMAEPRMAANQVLVKVAATSVNPLDYKIRQGGLPGFTQPFPAVLHSDFAGQVVAVGSAVSQFKVGDEVYGCAGGVRGRQGALADLIAVEAGFVAIRPTSISAAEAAALPLVAITAWEALIDRINIEPGQRVLIHAGTGGVGHIAAQLAKLRGAIVYTTVSSTEKAHLSKQHGADITINYREETVAEYVQRHTGGVGFDVVLDTVGGETLPNSIAAAAMGGSVLSILAYGPVDVTRLWSHKISLHGVNMSWPMATGVGAEHHGEILREVAKLVDSGKLRPLVDPKSFTFEQIGAAHAHAESNKVIGKVVVTRN
jgi:NADPH2:quinone reductase